MYCSLIFIHTLYSYFNDEDPTAATDAYWELILSIGGDGIAAIGNDFDWMLLHYATMARVSKSMIQRIIKKHPPALKKGDGDNCLPLHLVCSGEFGGRISRSSVH